MNKKIQCLYCKKYIDTTDPHANNVKYCSKKCRWKAYYIVHKDKHTAYHNARYDQPWVGKIQCAICGRYYKRVCSHVYQRHDMTTREYKEYLWLDVGKWIISESLSDRMRESAIENNMWDQLKRVWVSTRWSENNPPPKYVRSLETQERLKHQWKNTPSNKSLKK